MKKNHLCLIFLFVSAFFFMGQVAIDMPEHDFGKIKGNQEAVHIFEIENTTDGTLFVEGVEAG